VRRKLEQHHWSLLFWGVIGTLASRIGLAAYRQAEAAFAAPPTREYLIALLWWVFWYWVMTVSLMDILRIFTGQAIPPIERRLKQYVWMSAVYVPLMLVVAHARFNAGNGALSLSIVSQSAVELWRMLPELLHG